MGDGATAAYLAVGVDLVKGLAVAACRKGAERKREQADEKKLHVDVWLVLF